MNDVNHQTMYNNLSPETSKNEIPFKEQVKCRVGKCNKCDKEGWIKSDGFDDGDRKNRLVIRAVPKQHIICMQCLDKETN